MERAWNIISRSYRIVRILSLDILAFLPARILIFGCIMGGLVVLYTMVHQGLLGPHITYLFKEGWISIIYTAGVWGMPLLSYGAVPDIQVILTMIIYFLLVLINVLVYSFYDYHSDSRKSQQTMATVFGRETTLHLIKMLILSGLMPILAAFLILDDPAIVKVYTILLIMTAVMGLILIFPRSFSKHERFSFLADAVFFLPGLLIWIW